MKYTFEWIRVILVCMTAAITASAFADEPLHPTSESFKRSGYDFLWEVIQDEYDEMESEDEAITQRHFEIIDSFIRAGSHYGDRLTNQRESFREFYPELLKIDDTPPLYVQYRYHSSQPSWEGQDQEFRWHGDRLLEIAYQMEETDYPSYISAVTWLRAASYLEELGHDDDRRTVVLARERGMDLLVEAADLDGIDPLFHEFLALRIAYHGSKYTTLPTAEKDGFNAKLLANQEADQWIGHFSTGLHQRALAWEARGGEYARDVTDEQWEGFYHHLTIAHKHLTKAWELHPSWPEAANELITVTMGHQVDRDRDIHFWFNEAISARIDDYATYTDFAYALTPKWQGSMEHMYALMNFIINQSEQVDNMGRVLVGVMNTTSNQIDDPLLILTDQRLLDPATDLMLIELDHGPEYHNNPWRYKNLRALALGHFEIGNYAKASELLSRGGGGVEQGWTVWKESTRFRRCVPLLMSPAVVDVIAGLVALDNDDIPNANAAFVRAKGVLESNRNAVVQSPDGEPFDLIDRMIQITQ
jgi:hypothetical protein